MKEIKEHEKALISKSFLSEDLAAHLLNIETTLDETRLLHLHRSEDYEVDKLLIAYDKQQQLIEKYLKEFISEKEPAVEDDLPPMIRRWVNPLLVELYMYEDEVAKFILQKEQGINS
ncbi:hypothetical protein V6R21_15945 [Limibacter armeniacum]|uniref:hypothetical protein n=1 Tax=Limibacter armeniacum TaxID=466084 RepID=UPI002FE66F69